MTKFLFDGPDDAKATVLLAHGAGAPMDSASLNASTKALAAAGLRVARFEFDYMAFRRTSASKRPPPRAEKLKSEYIAAIDELDVMRPLIIGGKSMGGRVASMIADQLHRSGRIVGLLCLGYPFHPVGKPDQLRTAHLANMQTPTLIVQGTRDPFGTREEVATYKLSKSIEILWLEDGDHELKPRKAVSGFTLPGHMLAMAEHVATWTKRLAGQGGR
ncbi:MAG TPA: alpha/beta family hydrolase [Xanthobacteraceae bacterium]|nr:alpha/beta family hydrolase [Xanthobacteraceae bacterium]